MMAANELKKEKNAIISKYTTKSDAVAIWQTLNTMVPILALMYGAIHFFYSQPWLTFVLLLPITLFILRGFVLLHDCGHGCQFKTSGANRAVGFVWGVICGIPQYVWSKHHDYHHATNGNWNKYTGPLAVISVDQYGQLSDKQKKRYEKQRRIILGPVAGFMYFLFNPRFTWMKGSVQLIVHLVKSLRSNRQRSLKDRVEDFSTPYWATWDEYLYMTANNLVLLSIWWVAAAYFGAVAFFVVYLISVSLAGAMGIILFTVQHNFEGSYASGDEGWNYFRAALEGTSFLELPKLLHWFTADIGYHHIHHLSARIPNYRLAECHDEFKHLFVDVKRLRLSDIPRSFDYILWDNHQEKIISIGEYNQKYTLSEKAA